MHELFVHPGFFFERLAVATALGLLIGFERQWRQRTAGLHTSTLVALGAALFTMAPGLLGSSDTVRVAAQIVSGVGFLAGGVILRDGFNVRGLITAATLWATAAVGVLVGMGFEFQATVGALVIALTNVFCMPLAVLITKIPRSSSNQEATYKMHVSCQQAKAAEVRELIIRQMATTSLSLVTMTSSAPHDGTIDIVADMTKPGRDDGSGDRMEAAILKLGEVTSANYEMTERST